MSAYMTAMGCCAGYDMLTAIEIYMSAGKTIDVRAFDQICWMDLLDGSVGRICWMELFVVAPLYVHACLLHLGKKNFHCDAK